MTFINKLKRFVSHDPLQNELNNIVIKESTHIGFN